jgi:hypothetical protein
MTACVSAPGESASPSAVVGPELAQSCGQARVSLLCERSTPQGCAQSRLVWRSAAGQLVQVAAPAEVGPNRFAGALACVQASDGKAYVAVQYTALPLDCKFCEFLFLYDEAGRLLTRSEPLILGTGADQRPNNAQFDRMLKGQGSPKLSWTYLR